MHMNRRDLLRATVTGAAAAMALGGLVACAGGAAGMITWTEGLLANIQAELTAFANIKGLLSATNQALFAKINGYITQAQAALAGFAVGSLVPVTDAQSLFTDLELAAEDAATVLPGNPIVTAIQAVLPLIAAAVQMAIPSAATPTGLTAAAALSRLKQLPPASW